MRTQNRRIRLIKINPRFFSIPEEAARQLGVSKKRYKEIKKMVEGIYNESSRREKLIRQGFQRMKTSELRALRVYLKDAVRQIEIDTKHSNTVVDDVGFYLLLGLIRDVLRNKH